MTPEDGKKNTEDMLKEQEGKIKDCKKLDKEM